MINRLQFPWLTVSIEVSMWLITIALPFADQSHWNLYGNFWLETQSTLRRLVQKSGKYQSICGICYVTILIPKTSSVNKSSTKVLQKYSSFKWFCVLNGPFPGSFLFFFFQQWTVNNVLYKILQMTGFELRASDIGSDCSAS